MEQTWTGKNTCRDRESLEETCEPSSNQGVQKPNVLLMAKETPIHHYLCLGLVGWGMDDLCYIGEVLLRALSSTAFGYSFTLDPDSSNTDSGLPLNTWCQGLCRAPDTITWFNQLRSLWCSWRWTRPVPSTALATSSHLCRSTLRGHSAKILSAAPMPSSFSLDNLRITRVWILWKGSQTKLDSFPERSFLINWKTMATL